MNHQENESQEDWLNEQVSDFIKWEEERTRRVDILDFIEKHPNKPGANILTFIQENPNQAESTIRNNIEDLTASGCIYSTIGDHYMFVYRP
jgi:hypothetical protein